jgi:hypothetical protein
MKTLVRQQKLVVSVCTVHSVIQKTKKRRSHTVPCISLRLSLSLSPPCAHSIIILCVRERAFRRTIMAACGALTIAFTRTRSSPLAFCPVGRAELLKWRYAHLAPNKCINYFNLTRTQAHHICRSVSSPLLSASPLARPALSTSELVYAPR